MLVSFGITSCHTQEGKAEIFNVEKLHQGKNDSDETMEFLYVDINPKTVVELSH